MREASFLLWRRLDVAIVVAAARPLIRVSGGLTLIRGGGGDGPTLPLCAGVGAEGGDDVDYASVSSSLVTHDSCPCRCMGYM